MSDLYRTRTVVDVPIPTERFGLTSNLITSPLDNPCDVDTETVAFDCWISPNTWE